jgi:hypothetical protein
VKLTRALAAAGLTTDSEFGARLAKQLATTCHPTAAK